MNIATTDQKARLLDLTTGTLEMVRDGNRDIEHILRVLQIIKDRPDFATALGLVEPLLKPIGTITSSARTTPFVAKECFVRDIGEEARVKISYIGDNFTNWFLEKTEEPTGVSELHYADLQRDSLDKAILAELGASAETALVNIFFLMEQQPNGEEGILLTNGHANIFYVKGVNGALCAVCVYWRDGGWRVDTHSVAGPDGWLAGSRVFSSNS